MTSIDQGRFSGVVRAAVDDAVTTARPGHGTDTRDVLLALMRVDVRGRWDRIALHFASEETIGRAAVADPQAASADTWGPAPLTGTCAEALTLAIRLADAYRMGEVSAGLAAVALVADRDSAATTALTGGQPALHPLLLSVLQDAIVGDTLTDLAEVLSANRGPGASGDVRPRRRFVRRPVSPTRRDATAEPPVLARRRTNDDSLTVLADALDAVEDDKLQRAYERLLLDAAVVRHVRPLVVGLPTRSAAEIVDRARDRYGTPQPDPAQLIATVTANPCDRLSQAFWLLGLPKRSVEIEAAMADARVHRVGNETTDITNIYTHLNGLLSAAVTVFIARHLLTSHDGWRGIAVGAAAACLAWSGLVLGDLFVAVLLGFWLGPVVAATALAMALAGAMQYRSERYNALCRTGIAATSRQWRRHFLLGSKRLAGPVTRWVAFRRERRLTSAEVSHP